MKEVLLATFHDVEPAQQLLKRLQQAGIQAVLHDDSRLQKFWFISQPLAAIHIDVLRPEYQNAPHRIQEWHQAEGVLNNAVRCPACQSVRVEYPQLTRKFVTPSLGCLLMAVGLIRREFYCFDCQYTWPPAIPLEPPRDSLGWPAKSKLWHPEQGQRKG